jgi:hypothetical protein
LQGGSAPLHQHQPTPGALHTASPLLGGASARTGHGVWLHAGSSSSGSGTSGGAGGGMARASAAAAAGGAVSLAAPPPPLVPAAAPAAAEGGASIFAAAAAPPHAALPLYQQHLHQQHEQHQQQLLQAATPWGGSGSGAAAGSSAFTQRLLEAWGSCDSLCDLDEEGVSVCAICLAGFRAGCRVTELPCGHAYHQQCVHPWLLQQGRAATCPLCKARVFGVS